MAYQHRSREVTRGPHHIPGLPTQIGKQQACLPVCLDRASQKAVVPTIEAS